MNDAKVVITGLGVVSPIGIGRDAYWSALLEAELGCSLRVSDESYRQGFSEISLFDTSKFKVHIAGEIKNFNPLMFLDKKGLRDLDRSTKLVCSAAKLAIDDSKIAITEESTRSIGVSVGATFGSIHSISQFDCTGLIEGPKFVNPSHFPNTVINSPASQVSIRFKIKGFNTTISTGFCAGIDAVSYASDFIRLNRAEAVLAGGVEELCEETFLGFHELGCLSGMDGTEPVSCPYDNRRNGVILSEGAGMIALEDEEYALRRGADILACVKGYANSFSPVGDMGFSRNGTGLKNAIVLALKDAGVSIEEIDYICSCANSSKELDRMETNTIKEVFGKIAYSIPVSSVKSMIGESFSASGIFAIAAAVGAIDKDCIPPTANYKDQDPECDLYYVPNKSRVKLVKNALVITADPYGNNAAIVIGKYNAA